MSDIRINGKGKFSSGTYDNIVINGSGLAEEDFTAQSIKANGVLRCQGDVKTETLNANGSFRCARNLYADRICSDGKLKCEGSLEAREMDCDGMAEILGGAHVGELDVDGMLTISGGNLEGDHITCDGSIRCDGQISADLIEAEGFISAHELVGDKIVIHSQMTGPVLIFPKLTSKAALIEATTIELTGVTAQTVNGRDIVIGPGCTIGTLDCSGTLKLHPMSQVGSITGSYTNLQ